MNESLNEITINFNQPPNLIQKDILALPLHEQDHWIALWMTQPDVLNDMRYRPLPTKPVNKDADLKIYSEEKGRIKNLNWRNLKWLKWAKKILADQEDLCVLIEEKINGFIDIEEHPEPINVNRPDQHWQD